MGKGRYAATRGCRLGVWSISALVIAVLLCMLAGSIGTPGGQARAAAPGYDFGLIGNDGTRLKQERAAGIETKVLRLSWREYYSSEGVRNTAYIQGKKDEIQKLRAAGFKVILAPGYHDTPTWLHKNYDNSYYVNQYGERYTGEGFSGGYPVDSGDANLVFNTRLRGLVNAYMKDIFSTFGTNFWAVRLGGGHYGELGYPTDKFNGRTNLYWGYDANARSLSPVPNWKPGQPSPNGEAGRFLNWYLDALVGYQNWQVSMVRNYYSGRLLMLYPSWGIRPGQVDEAISVNLNGSTSAERNGEVQRGYAFIRQVDAIKDPGVVVTTTWMDAGATFANDDSPNARDWSTVKFLSSLARSNPLDLAVYGENTGQGSAATMNLSAARMKRYGLIGMCWYNEQELFSGRYATLADYQRTIAASP